MSAAGLSLDGLTPALLLLGVLVLLALALHGWWQVRRLRQRRSTVRTVAPQAPVGRQEPSLGEQLPAEPDAGLAVAPAGPGQPEAAAGGLRTAGGPEPVLEEVLLPGPGAPLPAHSDAPGGACAAGAAEPAAGVPGADASAETAVPLATVPMPAVLQTSARRVPQLDALIDAIVTLSLESPITGELALAHLPPTRRAGSKPFYIEGLDAETGQWERFAPGRRYGELQAGVQLVNRSGALGEIEFSEFVHKLQTFADAVGASADIPDMLEVVARARELDALASPLDAQLSITLRTNTVAWSVAYVQQVAHGAGFVSGSVPGRMVVPGGEPGAPPKLVLALDPHAVLADEPQGGALRSCTLMLDVPQTPQSAQVFKVWLDAARRLSDELDASIVDNEGQVISDAAFAAIDSELQELYRRLEALDLAAGSPAAQRLFS